MAEKRVLAGSPEDMRWMPGPVSGMRNEVPDEEEPTVHPEPYEAEDLKTIAVTPESLPEDPIHVPEPSQEQLEDTKDPETPDSEVSPTACT